MKKQIFILPLLLLGAFLLFYPQTSRAFSCKCSSPVVGDLGCTSPSGLWDYYKDCDGLVDFWNSGDYVTKQNATCQQFSDEQCLTPATTQEASPAGASALDNLKTDLSVKKPLLEINIPGLNFSNVASSSDGSGTYFYIAWIPELISALYKFGLAIVSIVAVVVIIIQGLRVITSGGGEGKTTAYKKIFQAVMGLFIAWGSYAILYNINPALVQFNALKVKVIQGVPLESVVGEEDGEGMEDGSNSADTGEPTSGTKFKFCASGEAKCNDKCVEFFQQPAVCPFTARLSSPLKTGVIRCNYHITNPKSSDGAGYDINATYNLDLPTAVQTNVYAPIDSTAVFKPKNGKCGNTINLTFKEDGKIYTLNMCHLWDSVLKEGKATTVTRGQLIGRSGGACCTGEINGTRDSEGNSGCKYNPPSCQDGESTGRSTVPHLHIGNLAKAAGKFPILPCIVQE